MIDEYEKQKQKRYAGMKMIIDLGMGIILFSIGLFFLFRGMFKISFNDTYPPDVWDKVIGIMFLIYGSWRVYRGIQKNYFK